MKFYAGASQSDQGREIVIEKVKLLVRTWAKTPWHRGM
jgi:hypothetical protein